MPSIRSVQVRCAVSAPLPHVGHHGLDPAVAAGDQRFVQVDARVAGALADRVHGIAHRAIQPLDVVLVRLVRQQRPDRPRAARGRGPCQPRVRERPLHVGHRAFHRCGQAVAGRVAARRQSDRVADGVPQRVEPRAGGRDGRDHRRAEPLAQPLGVDGHAGRGRLVDHVEGHDRRHTGLDDLERQIQAAFDGAGVHHHDDRVGWVAAAAEDLVDRHLLVGRMGAQAVGAGQVDQLGRRPVGQRDPARGARDGDARVVADARPRAGQGVEDRGLAGVGIAGDENTRDARRGRLRARRERREAAGLRGSRRSRGRLRAIVTVRRVRFRAQRNAGRLGAAQRQQIAAQPDLERVAERRPADHLDPRAGQQAHLHEPAADARRAVDAVHYRAVADRKLVECRQGPDSRCIRRPIHPA